MLQSFDCLLMSPFITNTAGYLGKHDSILDSKFPGNLLFKLFVFFFSTQEPWKTPLFYLLLVVIMSQEVKDLRHICIVVSCSGPSLQNLDLSPIHHFQH